MSVFTKIRETKNEGREGLAERLKRIEIRTFELTELYRKQFLIEAAAGNIKDDSEANDSDSNTGNPKPENGANFLGRSRYKKLDRKDEEASGRPALKSGELSKKLSEIDLIQLEIENLRDEKAELDRWLIEMLDTVEYDNLMREIGVEVVEEIAIKAYKELELKKLHARSQQPSIQAEIANVSTKKEPEQVKERNIPGHDPESPKLKDFHSHIPAHWSKRFLDIH